MNNLEVEVLCFVRVWDDKVEGLAEDGDVAFSVVGGSLGDFRGPIRHLEGGYYLGEWELYLDTDVVAVGNFEGRLEAEGGEIEGKHGVVK